MKRRKIKDNIAPGEKQWLAIDKAVSIAVITVTTMLKENMLKEEEYKDNLKRRLQMIQRKYGYNFIKQALPGLIKRMTEAPRINVNLGGHNKNVKLRFEYLQEYLDSL